MKPRLAIAVMLLAVCAAYANSLGNGFHFDDFHTITDNPAIRSVRNIPRFFTDATTFSVLPSNRTYRPIVSTTLALDYMLGRGYVPFFFHLDTLLLFLAQLLLLNALYRLVLDSVRTSPYNNWLALFAAAWYGLHPAMAETVNYIIQRGDLYCTLGCVAALYLYVRFPGLRRTGLYLLPYIVAMLSKPPAAVFPLLLLLYIYFFVSPEAPALSRLRRATLAAIPSLLVTVALLWLQSRMTPKSFLPSTLSASHYRLTQPLVWARYTAALFLPTHLNVDTDLTPFTHLTPSALFGILFVAALLTAIWIASGRRTLYPIAFGLLWFVVTQLPTSLYPLSEPENDHRMFFSFVGLILAVVWAVWLLLQHLFSTEQLQRMQPALLAFALILLGSYAVGVHVRNTVWRDEESLWFDDVQKCPRNGRGLMNYALTQMEDGAYPAALDYFTRALAFTPNYPTLEINLGIVNGTMADQGDIARTGIAEAHFQRAIALAPHDDASHAFYGRWLLQHARLNEAKAQLQTAVDLDPQRPLQHDLLIQADLQAGDIAAAQAAARQTLAIVPGDAAALAALRSTAKPDAAFWINQSLAQYRASRYSQSIESARKALAIDPNSAEAYNNIGAAYGAMQQWDEAIRNEQLALDRNPTLQIAKNNLALYRQHGSADTQPPKSAEGQLNSSLAFYRSGNYRQSIAAAREALRLRPGFPEAWNNIAASEAALHHWDEAIVAAQKAIALKPDFQLAKNNLAWAQSQKALQKSSR